MKQSQNLRQPITTTSQNKRKPMIFLEEQHNALAHLASFTLGEEQQI